MKLRVNVDRPGGYRLNHAYCDNGQSYRSLSAACTLTLATTFS
jgi:hypothetical protein